MEAILLTVHYLICFFLIVAILLQVGKGADIGAVFGGASQTVFGGRGPTTFLSKMTAVVAMMFLVTSITLAHISKTRSMGSVIDKATPEQTMPAAPEGAAPVPAEAAKPGEKPAEAPAAPQK
jgi:preprotein translocase subunit SecG